MLSVPGKLSAIVVIAAGALMLDTPDAMAGQMMRDCTEGEIQYACSAGVDSYQVGDEYFCGYYAGGCSATDGPNGTEITWNVQYWSNGTQPCPSVQPC